MPYNDEVLLTAFFSKPNSESEFAPQDNKKNEFILNLWIGKLYFRELRIPIALDSFIETIFRWFVFSVSHRKLKIVILLIENDGFTIFLSFL